jgi:carboxyl-terminal processing protease
MQLARVNPKLGSRLALYGGARMFEIMLSDHVIVIRFQAFGAPVERVMSAYREVARALPPPGPVGVVLDLRGNTGGVLNDAIELASQFLERGPVAMVAGSKTSSVQRFPVRHAIGAAQGQFMNLPLVVVVNSETASGAEIIAGALQLRQRAVVVGTATFAMGEIDTVLPITRLGALRFTTGHVFLPGIYPLHDVGIAPTVCLAGASGSDAAQIVAAGLRTMAPYAGRPRAELTLDERAAARKACPGTPREPALDLVIAEYLARDPAAYRRALDSLPANPSAPGE